MMTLASVVLKEIWISFFYLGPSVPTKVQIWVSVSNVGLSRALQTEILDRAASIVPASTLTLGHIDAEKALLLLLDVESNLLSARIVKNKAFGNLLMHTTVAELDAVIRHAAQDSLTWR